jgi:TetR/AcrR family transcriptional repressor of nem operon
MARTKEFDPNEALESAMHVFWQRGYEATSMSDLIEVTGVARASIYATFGSKHAMYLRALERYVQQRDPGLVEHLSQSGPVLPTLRELIEGFASEADTPDRRGCYVVNAAVERLPEDGAVALAVEASWETLEVALTSALMRARAGGELRRDVQPQRLARLLLVVLQGLRVISKGRPGTGRAKDAAAQVIAMLDAQAPDRAEYDRSI